MQGSQAGGYSVKSCTVRSSPRWDPGAQLGRLFPEESVGPWLLGGARGLGDPTLPFLLGRTRLLQTQVTGLQSRRPGLSNARREGRYPRSFRWPTYSKAKRLGRRLAVSVPPWWLRQDERSLWKTRLCVNMETPVLCPLHQENSTGAKEDS